MLRKCVSGRLFSTRTTSTPAASRRLIQRRLFFRRLGRADRACGALRRWLSWSSHSRFSHGQGAQHQQAEIQRARFPDPAWATAPPGQQRQTWTTLPEALHALQLGSAAPANGRPVLCRIWLRGCTNVGVQCGQRRGGRGDGFGMTCPRSTPATLGIGGQRSLQPAIHDAPHGLGCFKNTDKPYCVAGSAPGASDRVIQAESMPI
ncbi:hypothetical protein J2X19_001781 [Rhodoferax ferrireducens]|uniref:Uncharacterized protein n=1 Tax=Rhodoferax ferrireducens TaxID=192843 RepID=A0ABU2C715_9BURK|nr:hypothetical protein [Rhodoferax ferrireducens]